jgi:endonuclease III
MRNGGIESQTSTKNFRLHGKRLFNFSDGFKKIRQAIAPFPPAMLQQLKSEGYTSSFEQMAACMISIRTFDEVSLLAARELLKKARTPQAMARLNVDIIDKLIGKATFHRQKAARLLQIAKLCVKNFGGRLPCDENIILSLPGIGPKCANLILGIACGIPKIGVDIHVHRVTNRWGVIAAATPEKSLVELEKILPKGHWIEINRLLVPFGKHICTGAKPKCSTCPVLSMCRQVGVTNHR